MAAGEEHRFSIDLAGGTYDLRIHFSSPTELAPAPPVQDDYKFDGSCDETIEGVAGTRLDDGGGGAPDFKNTRPGIDFEILLTQANIVEEFWSTSAWQWSLGVEGPLEITDITLRGTVSCHPRDPPPDGGPQCLGGPTGLGSPPIAELTGSPYGKGPQTLENHGARSIVVLGLQFASLPGIGDYVVAKVRVSGTFPETEGESVAGRIFFTTRIGSGLAPIVPAVAYNNEEVTENKGAPRLRLLDCPLVLKAVGPVSRLRSAGRDDSGRLSRRIDEVSMSSMAGLSQIPGGPETIEAEALGRLAN